MLNRLASLLKVRADEGRLVILVALLFACIQAGQGMGDNAASALFLLRYGVQFLPYMYLFLGALTFVTTLAYAAALGRFNKGGFFLSGLCLNWIIQFTQRGYWSSSTLTGSLPDHTYTS